MVAVLASPTGDPPPAEGSISGEVTLVTRPPRRSASRYPGKATGVHAVQALPAVVYLEGSVGSAGDSSGQPVMAQSDTAFNPGVLVIPVGTAVSFPNRDPFFHNVFSYSSPKRFDLGRYPAGDSKTISFDEAGIVSVYCEVHEFMRAAVIVVENPHWAILDESGAFTLEGVPAGEHTLVLWHADLGERRHAVQVREGEVARVSLTLGG